MLLRATPGTKGLDALGAMAGDPATALLLGNQLLVETKTRLIDSIRNDIATKLVFSFNARDRSVRIAAQHLDTRKEESISADKLRQYLVEAQNEFFANNSFETFEESYFFLHKISSLLRFYQRKVFKSTLEKELLICTLNEIVFLTGHGVVPRVVGAFNEAFALVKAQFPKTAGPTPSMAVFAHKAEFFDHFRRKIFKNKVQLRLLLASCLFHSEVGNHEKANLQATAALTVVIDLLKQSAVITNYYLAKYLLRARGGGDKKEAAQQLSLFYFSNISALLASLLARLEGFHANTPQKSTSKYAAFFAEVLRKEGFTLPEVDLSLLNNEAILGNIFLNDSTILSLTQLNFFNFDDEFVNQKLKSETTEISLLEKIAFLVAVLYILSTESRFREHLALANAPFYRILLDYHDTSARAKLSEVFLTKATEISYLFLSENFPFVAQIFGMFRKFELGRSKSIPESQEDSHDFVFLGRFKNGFRNTSLIPVTMKLTAEHLQALPFTVPKKPKLLNQPSTTQLSKENRATPQLDKTRGTEKRQILHAPAPQEAATRLARPVAQLQKIYHQNSATENKPRSQNFLNEQERSQRRTLSPRKHEQGETKKRGNSSKLISKPSSEKPKDRRASSSETAKPPPKLPVKISSKTLTSFPVMNSNEIKAARSGTNFFKKIVTSKPKFTGSAEELPKTGSDQAGRDGLKKEGMCSNVSIHVNNIRTMNFIMSLENKMSTAAPVKQPPGLTGVKNRTIQELIKSIN